MDNCLFKIKEKKLKRLFLVVLLIFTLVSCSKEESNIPEGMAYSENGAVDYYFYYPEEWTLDRNDGMVSVYANEKDHSNVSVTTFAAPDTVTSVDGYISMGETNYLEHLKSNFTDLEMLSDGEETTLGGVPARQYVFTATVAGDEYKFRQIIAFRYGYIYIFTYTSTLDAFDTHTDDVNSIVKEFTFK